MFNAQVIHDKEGKPEYVVIPYELYLSLLTQLEDNETLLPLPFEMSDENDVTVPHEVVGISVEQNVSLQAAWRIWRGLSQQDVAEKLGISQSAVSQLESPDSRPQKRTREKLAALYDCQPEQLILYR
ncbi:helix-turn-helix transcriptional regulator [Cronobacter sakazakii]|uniref:helix-turn-helix domain-containing protein n=1 Tax=Cronobacter sakazakii TaxID=28141 RepID=UPI0006D1BFE4|nr:helix-turn-helix transcriptional regulator [Cronobacter sakazakii]EGT5762077.1 XRE family transcriptional regulator [Cronobacter sakazakii]EIX1614682.1 helix-turn-helix transcriptional regulator [Cronobacter sakazakii]EIZ9126533.1 helix-turn-helix transcriptional regulator [Cronobacter sakazakii]EIZ9493036.1 helix-turn-helix transcriptional regulator [Cronobacter sakazakii]EJG0760115.1 helix-turn-helix transcriptional regulator [Cronobacter sakazakii]